jgi:glycine cleavage system H protein
VNKDPYGKGWMIKLRITNPAEINDLLTPEKYKALVGA